jgi:hypothetical protein
MLFGHAEGSCRRFQRRMQDTADQGMDTLNQEMETLVGTDTVAVVCLLHVLEGTQQLLQGGVLRSRQPAPRAGES